MEIIESISESGILIVILRELINKGVINGKSNNDYYIKGV